MSSVSVKLPNDCAADLVRAAVLAPSPDNNQPWRFDVEGDRLLFHLDPERALPSDVNSMFDLMGLGAAVENTCIAARGAGCSADVEYHPGFGKATGGELPPWAAAVHLGAGGDTPDPLEPHLAVRCTNRKLYSTRPIEGPTLARIGEAAERFARVRIDWVADRRRIRSFARVVAASDRFRFEYEPFHKEIYRQLRFTAEEAERTRDGLDLRTLELPPGTGLILRLLRRWSRMRLLNRLRLNRLLTVPSALSVWKSGALGVISVPEPSASNFLEGGRAFQRIWLAVQAEGLALQPLGSLPVFLGHLEQLRGEKLTAAHQRLSGRLGKRLRRLVPIVVDRTLLMVFRTGYAPPPKVRSLRRAAEDVMRPYEG